MEIFNNDDFSEDFMEFDDNLLDGDIKPLDEGKTPPSKTKAVKTPKNDQLEDVDDTESEDVDDEKDDDELEVLLPSGKGQDATDDTSQNSSTLSPKFFSSLVQALKEGGILEDIKDEDIKSQDDFFKVLEDGIKQREFSDLTDSQKEYLEALRDGIPHEEIAAHQQNIEAYNSITDEAIEEESDDGSDLRRTIITNNYLSKGFSEAKAKKLIDKIFESGEDVDEAKDALNELKTIEKQTFEQNKAKLAEQKKVQQKAEKESIDKLNKIVKETKEIIPGLAIPQALKNDVIKGLTQPVAFTEDNRPLDIISKFLYDNPIDGRFKLAYILKATKDLTNMGVLENKKAKKDAWKNLAESIKFKEDGGGRTEEDGFQFDFDKFKFD